MRKSLLFIVIAVLTSPLSTRADSIPVGDIVALSGTTLAARPELVGQVIDTISIPLSIPGGNSFDTVFQGTFISQVIRETATNTLDFYYRIDSTFGQTVGVGTVRLDHFGFNPDVDYFSDSAGTAAPSQATRVSPGKPDEIIFAAFSPELAGNGSTKTFFIRTSAIAYDKSGDVFADFSNNNLSRNEIDPVGPGFAQFKAFNPADALIPLPASGILAAVGILVTMAIHLKMRSFSAAN